MKNYLRLWLRQAVLTSLALLSTAENLKLAPSIVVNYVLACKIRFATVDHFWPPRRRELRLRNNAIRSLDSVSPNDGEQEQTSLLEARVAGATNVLTFQIFASQSLFQVLSVDGKPSGSRVSWPICWPRKSAYNTVLSLT